MSNQRRIRSTKAASPVIAGALFLLAMLIIFNALFLISSQYGLFFQDSTGRMRYDSDRTTENLALFQAQVKSQKLNLTLTNKGPLTVQLVSIWISEWNGAVSDWHVNRPLTVFLNPGQTVPSVGWNLPDTFNPALTYAMRIVTARGSVFPITYSPLSLGVSPGFVNTGFLSISFDPGSFLYTAGDTCTALPAWDVPGSSDDIVWRIQVTNHGVNDIKLYKWSAMAFIMMTKGTGPSSFTQETFFVVAPNSCEAGQIRAYDVVQNPYIVPKNLQGDTQKGGTPTWVYFATASAGGSTTQPVTWNAPSQYMIFMEFYFLYGSTELYTQIIPFAGVNFA